MDAQQQREQRLAAAIQPSQHRMQQYIVQTGRRHSEVGDKVQRRNRLESQLLERRLRTLDHNEAAARMRIQKLIRRTRCLQVEFARDNETSFDLRDYELWRQQVRSMKYGGEDCAMSSARGDANKGSRLSCNSMPTKKPYDFRSPRGYGGGELEPTTSARVNTDLRYGNGLERNGIVTDRSSYRRRILASGSDNSDYVKLPPLTP